jgi:hypothetical protein
MGRIENWYRSQIFWELDNMTAIPNILLLPFHIYYYIKWSCEN